LDRYQLATSAPRTAWGFQSRWRTVDGVATHDRCSLGSPDGTLPLDETSHDVRSGIRFYNAEGLLVKRFATQDVEGT
jgi:hypothetical protein